MSIGKSQKLAYLGIVFVVFVWGISPLTTLYFYAYYSPTIRVALAAFISGTALLFLSRKRLSQLNRTYFQVAIPTGVFYTAANVLQKIGLQYTTPAHYACLENLSCVVVPFLLWLLIRKRPAFLTIAASVLCICSTFILTGGGASQQQASIRGDVLCTLAGVCYGVNTAATGAFAKKLETPLYLMIQMFTEFVLSLAFALVFHLSGMETIVFSFDGRLLLLQVVLVLVTSTVAWLIRTNAMKHIDASVVAVMMPFSAVVTAALSVLTGTDPFTLRLVVGVVLGVTAIILSGLGDQLGKRKAGLPAET